MRWVTFYYDMLSGTITALVVHKDKEAALKHFNTRCRDFFSTNLSWKADKLPATYGYAWRKYFGISARAFKKMFNKSIDEALKEDSDDHF